MRKAMLALPLIVLLPISAYAADADLYGTYRLISTTAKTLETGQEEKYTDESGYITYGRDGRMFVLLVRGKRPKPESLEKMTDQQRVELFRTVTAYSGTYTFDGKTVEHHVDISWNEVFTGMTLRREVRFDGDRVILTTPPSPRSSDGKMGVRTLIFEKVK
jgi:Lipocalin-like domain